MNRFANPWMISLLPLLALTPACVTADPTLDEAAQSSDVADAPTARGYGSMVFDSQSDQYIVLGGVRPGYGPTPDVWAGNAAGTAWRRLGRLPVGQVVVAAYHAALDRTVVWIPTRPRPDGGGNLEPYLRADAISETWAFDVDTNTWEQVAVGGPPAGVMGPRMTYDAQSQRMILFGGFDYPSGSFVDQTWAFDLATQQWTNMSPATHPTGRNYHGQTYHAGSDRVVVVGGMDVSFTPTNHVWTYDYESNTWTPLPSPEAPARDYVTIASVGDRIVLHGGLDDGEVAQRDTWEFDLERWRRVDDGVGLMPRAFHVMEASEDKLLLFGGGPSLGELTNDVLEYRPAQAQWKQR